VATVREVMVAGVEVLDVSESVATAARYLAARDVDSVTVCQGDRVVAGNVNSRDIVTLVVARGLDPEQVLLGELAGLRQAVFVEAGAPLDEAASLMSRHRLTQLPVVEGARVVGNISQVDVVRSVTLRPWANG
jgi:CBS domain-containing protein